MEIPILRADGTVLQEPGYDLLTGIPLSAQEPTFRRWRIRPPSRAEAGQDAGRVWKCVEDFPFATDCAHKAAMAGRPHHSACPLWIPRARSALLIDANVSGCGKSLLADVVSEIVTGREMSRMSQPKDDDECRKRITAMAVAGETLMLLDNLDRMLGNASLDAALTATSWTDRILARQKWPAARRYSPRGTPRATMSSWPPIPPAARSIFAWNRQTRTPRSARDSIIPTCSRWVRQERPRLAVAAVTIPAAYCAAGRPYMNLKPWGSFEAWSDLVRQAIVWTGLPDPGATRKELTTQADREAAALRQLIAGWQEIDPDGAGMTVAASAYEILSAMPAYL